MEKEWKRKVRTLAFEMRILVSMQQMSRGKWVFAAKVAVGIGLKDDTLKEMRERET